MEPGSRRSRDLSDKTSGRDKTCTCVAVSSVTARNQLHVFRHLLLPAAVGALLCLCTCGSDDDEVSAGNPVGTGDSLGGYDVQNPTTLPAGKLFWTISGVTPDSGLDIAAYYYLARYGTGTSGQPMVYRTAYRLAAKQEDVGRVVLNLDFSVWDIDGEQQPLTTGTYPLLTNESRAGIDEPRYACAYFVHWTTNGSVSYKSQTGTAIITELSAEELAGTIDGTFVQAGGTDTIRLRGAFRGTIRDEG